MNKHDLYQGLPLPVKTKREREEEAKLNKTTHEHHVIETKDTKRQKKPLEFEAMIAKLAGYMLVEKKFGKATALFCQLIHDHLTVQSSEVFYTTLRDLIREKSETWSGRKEFQTLIATLDTKRDVLFDTHHDKQNEREEMLAIWKFLALTHAQLFTDDTYEFNKAVKVVKHRYEALVNNPNESTEERARRLHTEFMPLLRTLYTKRSVPWATTIVEGVLALATRHRLLFHELDRIEVDSWTKGMQDHRRTPTVARSAGSDARRNIVTLNGFKTSEAGACVPGRSNHPLFNKEI